MKNSRNGFTLIELLAVIVIIGVVSTIAIGSVISIINNGRLSNFKNSANRLIEAANVYYLNSKLLGGTFEEITFTVVNGKMMSGEKELSFEGKVPVGSSSVTIKSNGEVEINITDGTYCARGKEKELIFDCE